jgi:hypothetical protein
VVEILDIWGIKGVRGFEKTLPGDVVDMYGIYKKVSYYKQSQKN